MNGLAVDLTDKVVVVTGGSRGLGREIARGCAEAGADVVVASRKFENCADLARELEAEFGNSAVPYALHVGRWDQLEPFVDAVYERFGRVDVLVNNAGASPRFDKPSDVNEQLFDSILGLNAKGPFRLTALIGERMRAAEGGSIINISSTSSVRPSARTLPYAAAKAALNAMTEGFAQAYGPTVRVNTVMAGAMYTDIAKAWDMDAMAEHFERFALKRAADPAEMVGAVLYLASDAASYTTGATIRVDGGTP